MPRAARIKDTKTTTDILDYPGPDDINIPPDNLDEYMICLFGAKGIGKSTAAASRPDSMTLMFEPKRKNLKIRQLSLQKYTAEQIIEGAPDTFQLVANTTQSFIDDKTIKALNFDSIDIFYDTCYHSICASHNVASPDKAGRSSVDIWIEIRDVFASYFDSLRDTDMGITMLSHVKSREEATLEGGKMGFQAPSCSPACLKYIQQAVDIVLYYGYYNGTRAMMVRDEFMTSFVSPGVEGKFLQPDGKPINIFQIPNTPSEVYANIQKAFDNKLWDMDTPEDDRVTTTPSRPTKKKPPRK